MIPGRVGIGTSNKIVLILSLPSLLLLLLILLFTINITDDHRPLSLSSPPAAADSLVSQSPSQCTKPVARSAYHSGSDDIEHGDGHESSLNTSLQPLPAASPSAKCRSLSRNLQYLPRPPEPPFPPRQWPRAHQYPSYLEDNHHHRLPLPLPLAARLARCRPPSLP